MINISKENKIVKFTKSIVKTISSVLTMLFILSTNAYANIQGSKIATGTEKLVKDASVTVIKIAPIVVGLLVGYFAIRMGMADEQDKKTWQNRIKVVIFGFIITISASGIIAIFASYYQ